MSVAIPASTSVAESDLGDGQHPVAALSFDQDGRILIRREALCLRHIPQVNPAPGLLTSSGKAL